MCCRSSVARGRRLAASTSDSAEIVRTETADSAPKMNRRLRKRPAGRRSDAVDRHGAATRRALAAHQMRHHQARPRAGAERDGPRDALVRRPAPGPARADTVARPPGSTRPRGPPRPPPSGRRGLIASGGLGRHCPPRGDTAPRRPATANPARPASSTRPRRWSRPPAPRASASAGSTSAPSPATTARRKPRSRIEPRDRARLVLASGHHHDVGNAPLQRRRHQRAEVARLIDRHAVQHRRRRAARARRALRRASRSRTRRSRSRS